MAFIEYKNNKGKKMPGKNEKRMEKDALAKLLGMELQEVEPGYARAVVEITPDLLNGVGVTHGGAIFTLADFAFAAASNAHGPVALALNVNIHFMKATSVENVLTAVAREDNLTSKTGVYRMEVRNESDELVALAEGLVYRKNSK